MDKKKRKANRIDKPTTTKVDMVRSYNPLNKSTFSISDLGLNPFLNSLEIVVNKFSPDNQYTYDKTSGVTVRSEIDFDRQQSTRLYISRVFRLNAMKLNYSELRLFIWISYEMEQNKDYLWINVKRFLEESGMVLNTYKSSVIGLCKKGYIYEVADIKDVYWVNPSVFFNGNRVRQFPDNVVVYSPKELEDMKDAKTINYRGVDIRQGLKWNDDLNTGLPYYRCEYGKSFNIEEIRLMIDNKLTSDDF